MQQPQQQGTKEIHRDKPIAKTDSLGQSSLSDIRLLYTGFEGGDSLHAAHELDHHYLQELFSSITGGASDSNIRYVMPAMSLILKRTAAKLSILQRRCR